MKRNRYTGPRIAFALQQAEGGTPATEICRRMGIAEQTFHRWRPSKV
jgi:putative transposase